MATRTIANAGGNWNTAATWVETAVPTSADDVVATATSGALTLDNNGACRSIDFTNYVSTFTMNNSAYTLSIGDASGGAFRFVAGMTVTIGTDASGLKFMATSGPYNLYFAGKTVGGSTGNSVTFDGVGGSWVVKDNLSLSGYDHNINLVNGSVEFQANIGTHGNSGCNLVSSSTNIRSLKLTGAITWYVGSGTGFWNIQTSTNMTFICGQSTIDFGGTSAFFYGGSLTYYSLNHDFIGATFYMYGDNTFLKDVSLYSEYNSQVSSVELLGNQTINGTLTAYNLESISLGKIWCRILFRSTTMGVPKTLSVGTMGTLISIDFRDITAAGSANWNLSAISGGCGDCGGNTGITFTTGADMYWHHASGGATATGPWSGQTSNVADLRWFLATNGGGGAGRRPLPQDNAIFDLNSFDGAGLTVVIDGAYTGNWAGRMCKNITWTGATNSPTWNTGGDVNVDRGGNFYGNITLISGMTLTGSITYSGRRGSTITSAGKSFTDFAIKAPQGRLTLNDALTCTGNFSIAAGAIDSGNYNITVSTFYAELGTTEKVGTSTVTLTGTGSLLWYTAGPVLPTDMNNSYNAQPFVSVTSKSTIDLNTMDYAYMGQPFVSFYDTALQDIRNCEIFLSNTTATSKTFNAGNNVYKNLWIASGVAVPVTILAGSSTYENINFYGQGTITFTYGTTTTLTGTFGLWGGYLQTGGNYTKFGGVSGTLATVNSSSAGSVFNLVKTSGNVCCDYMSFRDATVSGGAKFFAGSHSTSVSGNTGWIMTDAVDTLA